MLWQCSGMKDLLLKPFQCLSAMLEIAYAKEESSRSVIADGDLEESKVLLTKDLPGSSEGRWRNYVSAST